MIKSTVTFVGICLVALGGQQQEPQSRLQLKEETMILEYHATLDEAVVIIQAETEVGLDRVEVTSPNGTPILSIRASRGRDLGMSGFTVESGEFSGAAFLENFTEGRYQIQARTVGGEPAVGRAHLSHQLPAPPAVLYPQPGAVDVPPNLVVGWIPDAAAARYQVILEQGDNDGLQVELPAGSSTLQIPDGVLAPGTETLLEVGAILPNGNRTLVEIVFTTW